MRNRLSRRGVTLAEVVVVLAIVLIVMLIVITALPAARERARSTQCQKNLGQIGLAVLLYDNSARRLPTVPPPGTPGESPIGSLLGHLGLPDFEGLTTATRRTGNPGPAPSPRRLPGFVCPSDTALERATFKAPISYRANAGSSVNGDDGPFAFGRSVSLADIRQADGAEYTAGFSERLLGTGRAADALANYANLTVQQDGGCGAIASDSWRGDAGADWSLPDWRSSLYNHAIRPNERPSCIESNDARARIGASSGHGGMVHTLLLDGRVTGFRATVDVNVWKGFGTWR